MCFPLHAQNTKTNYSNFTKNDMNTLKTHLTFPPTSKFRIKVRRDAAPCKAFVLCADVAFKLIKCSFFTLSNNIQMSRLLYLTNVQPPHTPQSPTFASRPRRLRLCSCRSEELAALVTRANRPQWLSPWVSGEVSRLPARPTHKPNLTYRHSLSPKRTLTEPR